MGMQLVKVTLDVIVPSDAADQDHPEAATGCGAGDVASTFERLRGREFPGFRGSWVADVHVVRSAPSTAPPTPTQGDDTPPLHETREIHTPDLEELDEYEDLDPEDLDPGDVDPGD